MNRKIDILKELETISPALAAQGNNNVFMVPEGYFETVAVTVLVSVKNEMAAAGGAPKGYFDSLSNNILSKIEGTAANELHQLSPVLAAIKKTNPFEVPENYFEQAGDEMAAKVMEEKTPALLENVSKQHPFDLVAGYFEQLPQTVLNKAKEQGGAKVVAMPKRSNAIWKFAAAAVFTGVMIFGVSKYSGTTQPGAVPVALSETRFNEKLENLAEEDIIKYLEKNGTQEDVAALTSGIDEADLPDQEAYFTDDATLDKFLEDIELKN